MSFWESKKIKKTRKPHTCEYCGCLIPAGSSCRNEVGTYDGDFNSYYLCERCVLFMDLFRWKASGELGDIFDEIYNTDLMNCPQCKSWRNSDREWIDNRQKIKLECDQCDHKWVVDLSLEALQVIQAKKALEVK